MTPEDLERAAKSLTFCGGLKLWEPKLSLLRESAACDDTRITVTVFVPHRDSGECGMVAAGKSFDAAWLRGIPASEAVNLWREVIAKLVVHEVDEGILFDGKRVFDPHAAAERIRQEQITAERERLETILDQPLKKVPHL